MNGVCVCSAQLAEQDSEQRAPFALHKSQSGRANDTLELVNDYFLAIKHFAAKSLGRWRHNAQWETVGSDNGSARAKRSNNGHRKL